MPRSTCSGCGEVFSSTTMFEKHRIGNYEEPIYGERLTGKTLKIVGYTPPTRRCMTREEMQATGYAFEHKPVTYYSDGKPYKKEMDVWYDPQAREEARAHFRKGEDSEEDAEE